MWSITHPLAEEKASEISEMDIQIASSIIGDIENGDTLQIGIGSVPNAVISMLKDHRHLGIHTEMLPDGVADLVNSGAIDGTRKFTNPGKIVATFAYGSKNLYDFIDGNPAVEMLPVSVVNDPREIAKEKISCQSTRQQKLICTANALPKRLAENTIHPAEAKSISRGASASQKMAKVISACRRLLKVRAYRASS